MKTNNAWHTLLSTMHSLLYGGSLNWKINLPMTKLNYNQKKIFDYKVNIKRTSRRNKFLIGESVPGFNNN